MLMQTKDPDSHLDYTVKYTDWLDLNDTITSAQWTISTVACDPAPLVASSSLHGDTEATVWLSGGTLGNSYTATCQITTQGGRVEDYSFSVVCQEH